MKTKYTIEAIGDARTKTFDIIKTWDGGESVTYRTTELSPGEFEDMGYNTAGDWQSFLNTIQDYYLVK